MIGKSITTLSVVNDVTLVTLNNIPNKIETIANIFTAIAKESVNIDMISQTAPYRDVINISFTLPDDALSTVLNTVGRFKKTIPELRVEVNSNNSKLSVYGEVMRTTPGVAARVFTILAQENIQVKLVTTSEVDISCLIYERDAGKAMEAIKREFKI
ncbi:ACT domain-containing protein [Petroclostridium sp. X23]|uniref:ACT domain-containing protein n=1 Tax=Petroclostridium sp. X23 TaxID=3045146 RepID=UPI0024AE3F9A|nr:ACT domain-containing protein [Petroclostridium sp. X23]WHH59021.1 ACT domain-containing protein [Petroclostridium sp. X23]